MTHCNLVFVKCACVLSSTGHTYQCGYLVSVSWWNKLVEYCTSKARATANHDVPKE